MRALGLTLWLLLVAMAPAAVAAELLPLDVVTPDGTRHGFSVELADTGAERSRGLMFRRELAEDRGMLFVYPASRPVSMWMKNTLIPLDMLFADATGRVVRIAEETEPLSLRTIESGEPVKYVLEIAGGVAAKLDLTVGSRLEVEALGLP